MTTRRRARFSRRGRQVKGPTALGDDPRRFWHLTWTLAVTDFKLRFFGSVLGYLWQLMRPLMLFGDPLRRLRRDPEGRRRPAATSASRCCSASSLFQFFTDATAASVRSIVMRESLVRKVDFPRAGGPGRPACCRRSFNLGAQPDPGVRLPARRRRQACCGAGSSCRSSFALLAGVRRAACAMLLSALFVRYRDVEPIWDVVHAGALLRHADPLLAVRRDRQGRPRRRAPDADQPARGRHPAAAPLGHRPVLREPGPDLRRDVLGPAAARRLGRWRSSLGVLYFRRAAPTIAELL